MKVKVIIALISICWLLAFPVQASPQDELFQAVQTGNLQLLKQALDQGVAINEPIYHTHITTALVLAIQNRHIQLARLLLEHGADPNLEKEIWSPLQAAVCNDDLATVQLLLQYGAKPDIPFKQDLLIASGYLYTGWTPLIVAVEHSQPQIIDALLKAGAQALKTDKIGKDALHHALEVEKPSVLILQRLLKEGYPLNSNGEYLNAAVERGQVDAVQILVQAGAQVNCPDADGDTSLLKIRFEEHPELLKVLLEQDANPFYISYLHTSVQDRLENAELGPEQRKSLTQQLLAAQVRWLKKIRERNGKHEEVDAAGWTDLMTAIAAKDLELVKHLLENGANPNHKDLNQVPVLLLAAARSPKCLPLLIGKGADINIRDSSGETPLIFATGMQKRGLVRWLLEHGADPNLENSSSETAFDIALEARDLKTSRLLRLPHNQWKRWSLHLNRQLQLWSLEFSYFQLLLMLWRCF